MMISLPKLHTTSLDRVRLKWNRLSAGDLCHGTECAASRFRGRIPGRPVTGHLARAGLKNRPVGKVKAVCL
jgi:hypothetical protein